MMSAQTRVARLVAAAGIAGLAGTAAATGCGDNKAGPDDMIHHDGGNPDAPRFPAPPMLGAQIDRMGRPLLATALIGAFSPAGAAKTALRDAYNHAADAASWLSTPLRAGVTIESELETNLAIWDGLDTGSTLTGAGCRNALHYKAPPSLDSYQFVADMLGDDELLVDTSRTSCAVYFAIEIELASGGTMPHMTCGGRMPSHDVVDVTYSVLTAGLNGLDGPANDYAPKVHGTVAAHSDVKETTFPFLGPPH